MKVWQLINLLSNVNREAELRVKTKSTILGASIIGVSLVESPIVFSSDSSAVDEIDMNTSILPSDIEIKTSEIPNVFIQLLIEEQLTATVGSFAVQTGLTRGDHQDEL